MAVIMRIAAALVALVLLSAPVLAQAPAIDAPAGQGIPAAGGVLVDIRTPAELVQTGRPQGAVHVALQGDDMTFRQSFVAEVDSAVGGDRKKPVALIDANGKRAAFAANLLASQGFAEVYVVGEGMLGSNLGPGWLARGLPVER